MLPRLCTSDTVVCLAPGPSLVSEDVDYCRGKATVVAVNGAVTLAPWADVLYSSDTAWWPRHKFMPDFRGLRVRVSPQPWQRFDRRTYPYVDQGVLVLRQTGKTGLELARDGLRTYHNSGGAAINLAVHLGARRILLLGYDMSPEAGRDHFYEAPKQGARGQTYAFFMGQIATMVAPLAAVGVAVINCSRRTALRCFPRADLRATLVGVPLEVAG